MPVEKGPSVEDEPSLSHETLVLMGHQNWLRKPLKMGVLACKIRRVLRDINQ